MVVGFVGLGTMGRPMARNLLRAGHLLRVFDLRAEAVATLVGEGALGAGSACDLASACEFVFTSLPGNTELVDVYLGPDGIAAGIRPGAVVIDTSTVTPATTRRVGRALAERGAAMLDASLARTEQAAIEGTLSIMVGGEANAFQRALPLLRVLGTEITHCGPLGSGNVVKLVNNQVVLLTVTALAEALTVGVKAGVDARLLVEVLKKSSGDSFVLRNLVDRSVLPGDFHLSSFPAGYARKDLSYVMELAEELDVPTFQTSIARQLYETALAMGYTREFLTIVFKVLETWGRVEVRG